MTAHNRRLRDQRGVVAVEFALIMVPLFLLVFGSIEFGRTYSQLQVYQGGAREMARCFAVQAAEITTCDPYDRLESHLATYPAPAQSDITVSVSPGPNGTPYACSGNRGETVSVSWPQAFSLNIPFWGNASITRTITGVFRCE